MNTDILKSSLFIFQSALFFGLIMLKFDNESSLPIATSELENFIEFGFIYFKSLFISIIKVCYFNWEVN